MQSSDTLRMENFITKAISLAISYMSTVSQHFTALLVLLHTHGHRNKQRNKQTSTNFNTGLYWLPKYEVSEPAT